MWAIQSDGEWSAKPHSGSSSAWLDLGSCVDVTTNRPVSEACPVTSLYLPAAQEAQAAVPLAYVPFGHVVTS